MEQWILLLYCTESNKIVLQLVRQETRTRILTFGNNCKFLSMDKTIIFTVEEGRIKLAKEV